MCKIIDSFLSQSTKYSYEIILVDDGSTDDTSNIIARYKNLYPDKIVALTQKNMGISTARSAGLDSAIEKYITFTDHDDWVSVDYVETLMNAAVESKEDIVK